MTSRTSLHALGVAILCTAATFGAHASIANGSFESANAGDYPPPVGWDNTDSILGNNRCTVALCGNGVGTALPGSGSAWIWFGGTLRAQSSSLSQNAVIDKGSEFLKFDFWTGSTTSIVSLTLSIDATDLWTVTQANAWAYAAAYSTVSIPLGALADGGTHAIHWAYADLGNQVTFANNWNLDNVRLAPAVPEPGTLALSVAGLLALGLRASRRER